MGLAKTMFEHCGVRRAEVDLPIPEVIRLTIVGWGSAAGRREILEKLDTGPLLSPQGRDAQMSAENVVEVLLLGSVVLADTADSHAEQIAIEMQARLGVGDDYCRVVDSQEESATSLPLQLAFAALISLTTMAMC